MITTRLFGGLGNQLFQYAAGRALAEAAGERLQIDARMSRPGTHMEYGLDDFAIKAPVGADLPPGKNQPLAYIVWRGLGRSPKLVREKGLGFDPSILSLRGDYYLHGYWQSEKYFKDVIDDLRDEFRIITPASDDNVRALDEISQGPSVSLHVRRGDYVSVDKNEGIHGTCDANYYEKALNLIAEKTGQEPVIYVFSNDAVWAEENLNFRFKTRFFKHNGFDQPHEDLRLMAACDHNIIVNSTFSWWGAWLNPSPTKVVVAPSQWFQSKDMVNPDIIPDTWETI